MTQTTMDFIGDSGSGSGGSGGGDLEIRVTELGSICVAGGLCCGRYGREAGREGQGRRPDHRHPDAQAGTGMSARGRQGA